MKKILAIAALAISVGCDTVREESANQPTPTVPVEKTWQPKRNSVVSGSYSGRGSSETFEDGSTHTVQRDARGRTVEDTWTPPTKERR